MILDLIGIHYGYGRHQFYLSDHELQEFKKFGYGDWIQTFTTLTLTKVSICLLLLRISPSKHIIRPIQGLIVCLIVSNVVLSLLWILQCIPVDAAWDAKKKETARCFTGGQVQRIIISQASESSRTLYSTLLSLSSHFHRFRFHTCRIPHDHLTKRPN